MPECWLSLLARLGYSRYIALMERSPFWKFIHMPAIRREEYACYALRLRLVKDFMAILKQGVFRGRLVATLSRYTGIPAPDPEN